MTVESIITRRLGITFIDARSISTEAKLSLGISGYPSQCQIEDLVEEAVRIFETKPIRFQNGMREAKQDLDAFKIPNGSSSSQSVDMSESCHSSNSQESFTSLRSLRRELSFWRKR